MATYLCKTTFGSFRFSADFAQAASNIYSLPDRGADESEGFSTPYQVADARHSPLKAARLLLVHFGRDYWCDPSCVDDGYAIDYTMDGKTETKFFTSDEEDEAREFAAEHGADVDESEMFDGKTMDAYINDLIVAVDVEDADEEC